MPPGHHFLYLKVLHDNAIVIMLGCTHEYGDDDDRVGDEVEYDDDGAHFKKDEYDEDVFEKKQQ